MKAISKTRKIEKKYFLYTFNIDILKKLNVLKTFLIKYL